MTGSSGKENNTIEWLLEPDSAGVRYLAMRDLVKRNSGKLETIKAQAHREGPIAQVLAHMNRDGYWQRPGAGYGPKYFGTVWSIILLSQLGASLDTDERIANACSYLLDHALSENGQFTINGVASGTIDCLQGNLCAALEDLGCKDPRLDKAFDWMARSVTGKDVASIAEKTAPLRYYAYKCGPRFACGANNKLPCAWGAVKVMLAFGKLPESKRTKLIDEAINDGVDFLLSQDPVTADYPSGLVGKPSSNWWKFGFPVFYVTDVLQIVEALTSLGYGQDPRLANAIAFIRGKQDSQGRWLLDYDYKGKTWFDFGQKKQPNKWVTLRAMRVLRSV
jgi:hypothetical protein